MRIFSGEIYFFQVRFYRFNATHKWTNQTELAANGRVE